ncbi:hypothetical protein J6590_018508 [Homalodisca vitripennis]|nr:hypothetical protein J6590_018508 [Homalodisca vitripennis]
MPKYANYPVGRGTPDCAISQWAQAPQLHRTVICLHSGIFERGTVSLPRDNLTCVGHKTGPWTCAAICYPISPAGFPNTRREKLFEARPPGLSKLSYPAECRRYSPPADSALLAPRCVNRCMSRRYATTRPCCVTFCYVAGRSGDIGIYPSPISPSRNQSKFGHSLLVTAIGQTCVHLAALNGNVEILRHLLWFGADINAKEWKGGHTCLHLAVERADARLCMFLLGETGIDADEMNYAGYTAYQAVWDINEDIASALRNHGVDTYIASDSDSDDDMLDMTDSSFTNGFQVNGLVNVGA